MFNERWVTLFLFVGLLGILLRAPVLVAMSIIPLALGAISHFLRQRVLRRARYERRLDQQRLFVGEHVRVTGRVTNESRLPAVSLYVRDDSPRGFLEFDSAAQHLRKPDPTGRVILSQQLSLPGKAAGSRTFEIAPLQRGFYRFPDAALRAIDPLGLGELDRPIESSDSLLVYPQAFTMDELQLPARQPLGNAPTRRRLVEDPNRQMGARDYAPGDSFRMIHWKASAHRGALQTRVHEHTSETSAVILFNVSTFDDVWFGSDADRFEWSISVAASMARWAHEAGNAIGFTSNGATPGFPESIRVPARRAPDQLARLLETLAMIGPFTLHRFEEFLLREQHRLPYNATQIIVTPLMNEAIELAIHRLARNRRLVVLCTDHTLALAGAAPCPVHHVPPSADFLAWQQRVADLEKEAQHT
jgi:uncharacterized protein (DUF58 family)